MLLYFRTKLFLDCNFKIFVIVVLCNEPNRYPRRDVAKAQMVIRCASLARFYQIDLLTPLTTFAKFFKNICQSMTTKLYSLIAISLSRCRDVLRAQVKALYCTQYFCAGITIRVPSNTNFPIEYNSARIGKYCFNSIRYHC